MLQGLGYQITTADVLDAHHRFMAVTEALGIEEEARQQVAAMVAAATIPVFKDALSRRIPPAAPRGKS